MAHMRPENYFPCFSPIEQGACRAYFHGIVPGYFVCAASVIDDYYAANSPDWEGREQLFLNMFRFSRETVEIVGVEIEVLVDGENFQLDWLLYDPIALDTTPPVCRQFIYSEV